MPPKKTKTKKPAKPAELPKRHVKKSSVPLPVIPKKIAPPVKLEEIPPAELNKEYIETIGRRKTSVARVRMKNSGSFKIVINNRALENYFPTFELRDIIEAPFKKGGVPPKFDVSVKVNGGGIHSQAEAIRHGISRALEEQTPELRKILKPLGFLKRDPRMKERRKFGLKKARKAPQWAKR